MRFISLGIICFLSVGLCVAQIKIISFDSSEVEVRKAAHYEYISTASLPTPPLNVHEVDDLDFLKIKLSDGQFLWINSIDVTTDEYSNVKGINCSEKLVAKRGDRKMYGGRGAGESCE